MYTVRRAWYKLLIREPDTEDIERFLGMSSRLKGPGLSFARKSCRKNTAAVLIL